MVEVALIVVASIGGVSFLITVSAIISVCCPSIFRRRSKPKALDVASVYSAEIKVTPSSLPGSLNRTKITSKSGSPIYKDTSSVLEPSYRIPLKTIEPTTESKRNSRRSSITNSIDSTVVQINGEILPEIDRRDVNFQVVSDLSLSRKKFGNPHLSASIATDTQSETTDGTHARDSTGTASTGVKSRVAVPNVRIPLPKEANRISASVTDILGQYEETYSETAWNKRKSGFTDLESEILKELPKLAVSQVSRASKTESKLMVVPDSQKKTEVKFGNPDLGVVQKSVEDDDGGESSVSFMSVPYSYLPAPKTHNRRSSWTSELSEIDSEVLVQHSTLNR